MKKIKRKQKNRKYKRLIKKRLKKIKREIDIAIKNLKVEVTGL